VCLDKWTDTWSIYPLVSNRRVEITEVSYSVNGQDRFMLQSKFYWLDFLTSVWSTLVQSPIPLELDELTTHNP